MKNFKQMIADQKAEVEEYRSIARSVTSKYLARQQAVLGLLLTGSVARGDARKGTYGLYIDITVVVEKRNDINLSEIFGPSIEPYIPKHCIMVDDAGIAFEITTMTELNGIRSNFESVIFSKQESIILFDRSGLLAEWKENCFMLSDDDIKKRALQQYFRFDYLICDYRIEKWKHRAAWVQMVQNGNEAMECYCNFLYCINGWFIPRKDWLAYLTYDLQEKMPNHNNIMSDSYSVRATEQGVERRSEKFREIEAWMKEYCLCKNWIS